MQETPAVQTMLLGKHVHQERANVPLKSAFLGFSNGAQQSRRIVNILAVYGQDYVAILHATLDFRRIIDVSGYGKITLDDATRFIATMNYGYAGTRELNEALASRFMVILMPYISPENLAKLFKKEFPTMNNKYMEQFIALFQDIQTKSENSEISTKCLDLRGFLSSIHLMNKGLEANKALLMGIINKSFDEFERQLIQDVIRLRIPEKLERGEIFTD